MGVNGRALKDIRLNAGLTQYELSKLLGVSSSTISRWEASKFRIPSDRQKLICNIDSGLVALHCSQLQPGLKCLIHKCLCVDQDCHFKARMKRNKYAIL